MSPQMPASTYRRLQMLGRVLAVLAAGLWIVVLVSTSVRDRKGVRGRNHHNFDDAS